MVLFIVSGDVDMSNSKFVNAIVSRGIKRAEFIQQKPFDQERTDTLRFDNPSKDQTTDR